MKTLTQVKKIKVVSLVRKNKQYTMFKALAKTELGDYEVTGKTKAELIAKARELYKIAKERGYI